MKRTILGKYKLLNAMHESGITSFDELSRASGVSRQTFYNMMRGNFYSGKLDKIANVLGVSPISLLEINETDDETEMNTAVQDATMMTAQ